MHQFRVSLRDNAEIVIDLLGAMRSECLGMGDSHGALLLSGLIDVIWAYIECSLKSPIMPPSLPLGELHPFG